MNQLTNEQYGGILTECAVRENEGIRWALSPMLEGLGLKHGFSQRMGGVSEGAFCSLNLGLNRPEPMPNIMENYRRFCVAAGLELDDLALCAYCHGDGVERAGAVNRGYGFGKGSFAPCDGLISDDPGVTMVTLHADCMPVIMYDPKQNAAAAVHAGWKGASLRVGGKASLKMQAELGCDKRDIFAWVGPSICRDRFEVDEDVMLIFKQGFGERCISAGCNSKYHVDLWRVMAQQLHESGIPLENIRLAGVCTYEREEEYFSYRRDKRVSGAMAGFAKLPV